MNFNIDGATILRCRHGSHAYGTNTETSDLDIKGVAIPPKEFHFGFQHVFDQHVQEASKGYPNDLVIFALKKFCKLAAECNPNTIEILYVDDSDVLYADSFGEELRAFRDNFLSLKVKHTLSGYAHAQLHRIKSHRNWLLNPPKEPPSRKDFGLAEQVKVSKSELGAFEALLERGETADLSKEALTLYTREKAYKNILTQWNQYQHWKASRNPARAELEAKYHFDTKHGSHLIRLQRCCKEILLTGKVNVKRPDREELLAIRNGARSYESLVEEAERLEQECTELYKTSTVLPKSPDINKIDAFVVDLTERFLYR